MPGGNLCVPSSCTSSRGSANFGVSPPPARLPGPRRRRTAPLPVLRLDALRAELAFARTARRRAPRAGRRPWRDSYARHSAAPLDRGTPRRRGDGAALARKRLTDLPHAADVLRHAYDALTPQRKEPLTNEIIAAMLSLEDGTQSATPPSTGACLSGSRSGPSMQRCLHKRGCGRPKSRSPPASRSAASTSRAPRSRGASPGGSSYAPPRA